MKTNVLPDLSLNRAARIQVRRMGREGQPLLIIDDALSRPDDLVDFAGDASFFAPKGTWYPGINAFLPQDYARMVMAALRPLLGRVFGLPASGRLSHFGFLGLATATPDRMEPVQKVPHIDSPDPRRIAVLHFLSKTPQGGTGFFRHRASGFEAITPERFNDYELQMRSELRRRARKLTRYTGAHTPGYEQIDAAEAVYNRLIVYRSNSLHAGLLEGSALSEDPHTGRLTANSFIDLKAA